MLSEFCSFYAEFDFVHTDIALNDYSSSAAHSLMRTEHEFMRVMTPVPPYANTCRNQTRTTMNIIQRALKSGLQHENMHVVEPVQTTLVFKCDTRRTARLVAAWWRQDFLGCALKLERLDMGAWPDQKTLWCDSCTLRFVFFGAQNLAGMRSVWMSLEKKLGSIFGHTVFVEVI